MGEHTPLCLGLDDSETLQMLLDSVFSKIGADAESRSLGATAEEQDGFIDLALGKGEINREADIVVLDQNLNLPQPSGKGWVARPTGTEVAPPSSAALSSGTAAVCPPDTAAPLIRIITVCAGTALPLAASEACAATHAKSVSFPVVSVATRKPIRRIATTAALPLVGW